MLITTRFQLVAKSSLKLFYSITKRTDILFGGLVRASKYRSERVILFSLLALTIVVHIRPDIRMVNTLRVGRVFIGGGQLSNLILSIGRLI